MLILITSVYAGPSSGQATIGLERFEGPSMAATGGALNEGSTLQREWFVLNDESGPVRIDGKTGIEVVFDPSRAYASVAYVASARLASGGIYEIDRAALAAQVRTVAEKVTDALLEPERPLLLISNCLD